MNNYETVIGLEVHVQLATESKAFCGCSVKFGQSPNSSTCPVCEGLPGSLPVLNEKAFYYGIKTALALKCKVQDYIKFDRKNYYYPDLPKNYQISQYDKPLAFDGFIEIELGKTRKKIGVTRVHLEEDAGKLMHLPERGVSYVDLNRAGTPLMEIVSEPDMRTAEEASAYLEDLKAILLYLRVSDCNMEEGSLRCDANISVRKKGVESLGVKAELKNMNSFKAVRDAISYESKRQIEAVTKGEKIIQETRLWNEEKGITLPMRSKEESHDYRYFPEPDLVPFTVGRDIIEKMRKELPELPKAKRERFISEYSLNSYDAEVITRDIETASFFEDTVKSTQKPKEAANWIIGDIAYLLNQKKTTLRESRFRAEHLIEIINLISGEEISGKIAKDILSEVFETGISPVKLVKEKGLKQIKDTGELETVVEAVLSENKKSVDDYKGGKANALMFLVGQIMKKTKGKASPRIVNEVLKKKLEG